MNMPTGFSIVKTPGMVASAKARGYRLRPRKRIIAQAGAPISGVFLFCVYPTPLPLRKLSSRLFAVASVIFVQKHGERSGEKQGG